MQREKNSKTKKQSEKTKLQSEIKTTKKKVTIREKVCTTYIIKHNAQGKYI